MTHPRRLTPLHLLLLAATAISILACEAEPDERGGGPTAEAGAGPDDRGPSPAAEADAEPEDGPPGPAIESDAGTDAGTDANAPPDDRGVSADAAPRADPVVCEGLAAPSILPPPREAPFHPSICPAPTAVPWTGLVSLPLPEGASDARVVATDAGLTAYWRVAEGHYFSRLDAQTGAWEAGVRRVFEAGATSALVAVCDGVLLELQDEAVPDAEVSMHLVRSDGEVVSRTMPLPSEGLPLMSRSIGVVDAGLWIVTELDTQECAQLLYTEALNVATLELFSTVAWPETSVRPHLGSFGSLDGEPAVAGSSRDGAVVYSGVPPTAESFGVAGVTLFSDRSLYAVALRTDDLQLVRRSTGEPLFRREISLPPAAVRGARARQLVMGPGGDLFLLLDAEPEGALRLLHLDTNGARLAPDALLPPDPQRVATLLAWPGGVALARIGADELTVESVETAFPGQDLEVGCRREAYGPCGSGHFELRGAVWHCVTPEPGAETCNAVDDDCDGQVDEAPAGCDFRWTGPAVSPPPPLSCSLALVPWPAFLWAQSPNPDPCAAFQNIRPCGLRGAVVRFDVEGHLTDHGRRHYEWAQGRPVRARHDDRQGVETLTYNEDGRLVQWDAPGDPSSLEYDASGRLVRWGTDEDHLTYEWAPDGSSLTVRSMSFHSLRGFDVVATLEDGQITAVEPTPQWSEVHFGASSELTPAGPRCGGHVRFSADDSDFASGDETHESWSRSDVMDAAGRLRATESSGASLRDESNPQTSSTTREEQYRFDAVGRPTSIASCSMRRDDDGCAPEFDPCGIETIEYCP